MKTRKTQTLKVKSDVRAGEKPRFVTNNNGDDYRQAHATSA
jgi:hypothetical protein